MGMDFTMYRISAYKTPVLSYDELYNDMIMLYKNDVLNDIDDINMLIEQVYYIYDAELVNDGYRAIVDNERKKIVIVVDKPDNVHEEECIPCSGSRLIDSYKDLETVTGGLTFIYDKNVLKQLLKVSTYKKEIKALLRFWVDNNTVLSLSY